jgi:hypothetical protein
MTMLPKAKGSDEKRNNDLAHAIGGPPNPSLYADVPYAGLRLASIR